MLLLNPGPVTLSARVREALRRPDLCHREPEFATLQNDIRAALLGIYGLDPATWAAVLLTGSGTAALEAMITSTVPARGRVLVIENGVYGERLSRIAAIHGIAHDRATFPWGGRIDPAQVVAGLDAGTGITHLAVVHHETTTGRLNDVASLGRLCRERGIELLVDAVSSFAGEPIDLEAWGVTACAATANKCLHGVPGAAFAIVRRVALARDEVPHRTLYLDLRAYCRAQDEGSTPFTQSVQSFYALDEALRELADEGGWQVRHATYRRLAGIVRDGAVTLGIRALLPPAESSVVLSAYDLPAGIHYPTLHDRLKAAGFVIYAGQGSLAQSIFRISTMGAIEDADMHRLVAVLEGIVRPR